MALVAGEAFLTLISGVGERGELSRGVNSGGGGDVGAWLPSIEFGERLLVHVPR